MTMLQMAKIRIGRAFIRLMLPRTRAYPRGGAACARRARVRVAARRSPRLATLRPPREGARGGAPSLGLARPGGLRQRRREGRTGIMLRHGTNSSDDGCSNHVREI